MKNSDNRSVFCKDDQRSKIERSTNIPMNKTKVDVTVVGSLQNSRISQ